ncbi:YkgB family protein [Pseudomonas sp.]|uniref:YkgB family protein n=1 Tax=Pseudomonas sp. TaxID=306 RepID=UPI003A983CCB
MINNSLGAVTTRVGWYFVFSALTVIYIWFGGMKFTEYEANGIYGFVSHSPLLSWMYGFISVMGFSYFLGFLEIAIGLLIAARCISPRLSFIGGGLSAGLFITTLSFMLTTPQVFEPTLGFPAISVVPGQFLLKDICLLAASIMVIGNSLTAIEDRSA